VPATPAPGAAAASGAPATPRAETPAGTPGEPPRERWNDILSNARAKARAEAEQEFRQRYGQYEAFERDPWGAVQSWLKEASGHSLYGPMVKQWAGQYLNSLRGPAGSGEEPKADIPVVDDRGNVTGYTYSDQQLRAWNAWNQSRLKAELDDRFSSIEQREAERQRREEYQALVQDTSARAAQILGTLRQQPYFKEHEADIRAALEEHEEWGDNVHAAYNHVLVTKVLPTLSRAEQQSVINTLTGKAAGTTVSPNGTAPAAPSFKSFKEAAKYYEQHPEEAAAMARR
jgi:hypothetical protein